MKVTRIIVIFFFHVNNLWSLGHHVNADRVEGFASATSDEEKVQDDDSEGSLAVASMPVVPPKSSIRSNMVLQTIPSHLLTHNSISHFEEQRSRHPHLQAADKLDWTQIGNEIFGEEQYEMFDKATDASSFFGWSVAMSMDGNRVAVGSLMNIVRVFQRVTADDTWEQVGNTLSGEESFGESLDISADGNRVIVGAPSSDCVYIFQFMNNDTWEQIGSTLSVHAAEQFGRSVAISADGRRVAVGAPTAEYPDDDDGSIGFKEGIVRIFEQVTTDDSDWIKIGDDIVGNSVGDEDFFGWSIAMSEDGHRVVVGAPNSDGGYGSAWVFHQVSVAWELVGNKIIGAAQGERFGYTVAVSEDGSRIAVGEPGYNDSGRVHVYDQPPPTGSDLDWIQVGNSINGVWFGASSLALSADGKRVAAGAFGYIRVFDHHPNTESGLDWIQIGSTIYDGWSVDMSADGSSLIIGGDSARVFDLTSFTYFSRLEEQLAMA